MRTWFNPDAARAPRAGGVLSKALNQGQSDDKKRVPVPAIARFTARARQRDGLSSGDQRPPDGGALSLERPRQQVFEMLAATGLTSIIGKFLL